MTSTTHTESTLNMKLSAFTRFMNASTITIPYISRSSLAQLPATPRGSALYHVDWFLNGHPSSRNHDNAKLTITDLVRV